MTEQALLIGKTQPLVAVITAPDAGAAPTEKPAVLLLNAGIVHHIGPGRWAVRLARRLAERGHLVVRFDHAGLGDSDARNDGLPFAESSLLEVREVMDYLRANNGAQSFIAIGLCSGASTAVLTAQQDERIVGAVLINPPGGSGGDAGVDQHLMNEGWAKRYLSVAMFDPRSWWRALTGRIEYRRMARVLWTHLLNRIRPPKQLADQFSGIASMLQGITQRGTRLLFVFSANDEGSNFALRLLEDPSLGTTLSTGAIQRVVISGTDHTFALHCSQEELFSAIERFTSQLTHATPLSGRMDCASTTSR
jgi:pimeloyl-ACP methyl ester carboxylesterase